MSANKVLVVVKNGLADIALVGEVDVLLMDLDSQDKDELVDEVSRFTPEWREAFPSSGVYLDALVSED